MAAAKTPSGNWPQLIAMITGCVVVGLAIGLMAGLAAGSATRYLVASIIAGAVLSIPLVVWQTYRTRRS